MQVIDMEYEIDITEYSLRDTYVDFTVPMVHAECVGPERLLDFDNEICESE